MTDKNYKYSAMWADTSRLSVSEKLKENDEETKTAKEKGSRNEGNDIILLESGEVLQNADNRTGRCPRVPFKRNF